MERAISDIASMVNQIFIFASREARSMEIGEVERHLLSLVLAVGRAALEEFVAVKVIFQQRLWGLPKMGTPFDTYLLNDFIEGRTKPYKLLVFLNPFRLDAGRRRALTARLDEDGSTALWIYAPGYIQDDCSTAHMEELTGIRFGLGEQPWGPLVHITDFDHPITAGLAQDLVWGTNAKLAPLFHVDDPGRPHSRPGRLFAGRLQARLRREEDRRGWTSVYSAAPNLPASVLRGVGPLRRGPYL